VPAFLQILKVSNLSAPHLSYMQWLNKRQEPLILRPEHAIFNKTSDELRMMAIAPILDVNETRERIEQVHKNL
jgi:hypothetical protein